MNRAQLIAITGRAPLGVAEALSEAMARWSINTPARQALFIGQIAHESGAFRWAAELWGPTPQQLTYEGRVDLGNTQPGDGFRYRGRGYLQITGRENYAQASQALDVDLINNPEQLEQLPLAAEASAWWWFAHGCNELADPGDESALLAVTRRVNGGTNGLESRRDYWLKAKMVLEASADEQEPEPISETPTASAEVFDAPVASLKDLVTEPKKESAMPAPIAAVALSLLPTLIDLLPSLAKMFSKDKFDVRNEAIATQVAEIATKAVGAVNAQQAVERIAGDPAAQKAADAAMRANFADLMEIAKLDEAHRKEARAFALEQAQQPTNYPLWLLTYLIIGGIGWVAFQKDLFTPELVTAIVMAIIGFHYGSSYGSMLKTQKRSDG
jgi:putative chitinase